MKNKFKFWCKGTSENKNFSKEGWWSYPNFLLSKYYADFDIFDCPHFVACQSTGFADKNGKEIYEGDIVKVGYGEYIGALGKVIFEYGAFMLSSKHGYNFQDTYKSCLYGEVIGNVFENKDLL